MEFNSACLNTLTLIYDKRWQTAALMSNSGFTTDERVEGSKTVSVGAAAYQQQKKTSWSGQTNGLTGQLPCGCAAVVGWNWPGSPPAPPLHPHAPVSAAQTAGSPVETQTWWFIRGNTAIHTTTHRLPENNSRRKLWTKEKSYQRQTNKTFRLSHLTLLMRTTSSRLPGKL